MSLLESWSAFILRRVCLIVLKTGSWPARVGWLLLSAGAVFGLILIKTGTLRTEWNWLYLHIALSAAGFAFLVADARSKSGLVWARAAFVLVFIAAMGTGAWYLRDSRWQNHGRIENPLIPPATMNAEGDGPQGPFFPSSAQVYGGQKIPSKFFMESDSCKRCHEDIYNQWFSSAHHFSSFNNQWYRKSIEYMQDTIGTKPSKWCGGCHDPAVLYSGLMDTPIKQIVHRPESQAGLGCMMCHSIADVKSTMGQGDFYLEYPKLHELAASKNPVVRTLARFPDQAESGAASPRLSQALHAHADGGVLLQLPQGSSGCASESLSLDSRLQRIRQLAGQRSLRAGRAVVLLSGEALAVRRLPYAADEVDRSWGTSTASCTRIAFPPRTQRFRPRMKMRSN